MDSNAKPNSSTGVVKTVGITMFILLALGIILVPLYKFSLFFGVLADIILGIITSAYAIYKKETSSFFAKLVFSITLILLGLTIFVYGILSGFKG